ncbi:MAG: PEP-CTERM sorting domain-containing protein [Verrucomicrobiota bacterium]
MASSTFRIPRDMLVLRRGFLLLCAIVCGVSAQAQVTVNNVGLTDPWSFGFQYLRDGNPNSTTTVGVGYRYYDDADNWSFGTGSFSFNSSLLGNLTITNTNSVTSFNLQLQNHTGINFAAGSRPFILTLSGLFPANSNYTLSGINLGVTGNATPADFNVGMFSSPPADTFFPGFGVVSFNQAAIGSMLVISVASNFIIMAGSNLFLTGTFTAQDASAVPEPATYALLLGLAAVGYVAWRRRSQPPVLRQ